MVKECQVCCEECKDSNVYECPSCKYLMCFACCKAYINTLSIEPKCPVNDCQIQMTHVNMKKFGQTWYNKVLKEHLSQILLEEDKIHHPQTIQFIADKRFLLNLLSIHKHYKKNSFYEQRYTSIHVHPLTDEERSLAFWSKDKFDVPIDMENDNDVPDELKTVELKKNNTQHKNCIKENCRGIQQKFNTTLNNFYFECRLCFTQTCIECDEKIVKNENATLDEDIVAHKCKEEDLKTAEMIRKSSKQCPNCLVPIHKVSGCSQMWCYNCKVVFDWNTLAIQVKGHIHNPDYFAWVRNTNQTAQVQINGPGPLNGVLNGEGECIEYHDKESFTAIYRFIEVNIEENDNYLELKNEYKNLINFFKDVGEILNSHENERFFIKMEDRCKYLTQSLSEKEYKSKLFSFYKSRHHCQDMLTFLRPFTLTCFELMKDWFINNNPIKSFLSPSQFDILTKMCKQFNDEMEIIYSTYSLTTYKIVITQSNPHFVLATSTNQKVSKHTINLNPRLYAQRY